jgi:aldose 1-epimerase
MEADDELLPTGRLLDVRSIMYAMFDLRQPVPIANLKLDHVYTGLHKNESAVIEYRKQAMKLRIITSEDFTHLVIYTPPPEAGDSFFCLENQTCSTDAINLSQRGLEEIAHLLELHPGESRSGFLRYAIE